MRTTSARQGPGRPSLRYTLTPLAEALLPSRDAELLGLLLDFLLERGHDAEVEAFFEAYWDERLGDVQRRPAGIPDGERMQVLADVLREQGFMPDVRQDAGGGVIRECNCPFPEAVTRTRLPCRLEARFLEQVVGDRASRVTYIPDGAPACTYEFADPGAAA